MEKQEKKKTTPTRFYICCPVCSKTLVQAEHIKNAIIRCDKCRNDIFIEIENSVVNAKLLDK